MAKISNLEGISFTPIHKNTNLESQFGCLTSGPQLCIKWISSLCMALLPTPMKNESTHLSQRK